MAQGAPLSHEYPRTAAGTCGRASMRCTPRGCTQLPVHAWPAWPSTARASGAVAFDIDAAVQDSASSARSGECVIKASSRARRMKGHSRDDGWRQDQPPNNSQKQPRLLVFAGCELLRYPHEYPSPRIRDVAVPTLDRTFRPGGGRLAPASPVVRSSAFREPPLHCWHDTIDWLSHPRLQGDSGRRLSQRPP
jgi:hypothetical protein